MTRQLSTFRTARAALVLAALYFLAAKLAAPLTLPPGYAAAVSPGAGIALAGLMLFSYRLWPGVFIGAFAASLWLPKAGAVGAFDLSHLLLPATIATGASLQALLGRFASVKLDGLPFELITPLSIVRFVLVTGFLVSTVGASVGVTGLFAANVITADEIGFYWLNWWVGNSIGVIVFVPVLFALRGSPVESWGWRRWRIMAPLVGALIAVTTIFFWAESQEEQDLEESFHARVQVIAESLDKQWATYMENLYGIRGFIGTTALWGGPGEMTSSRFRQFVSQNLSRLSGVQALSFNPVVMADQRGVMEEAMRARGYLNFSFQERSNTGELVQAGPRDKYVVVQFIEPHEENKAALGFDVYSNPARRMAMDEARDGGRPVATAPITLVQETESQAGILVFLPVYRTQVIPESIEQRRTQLAGFAVGVFRIGDLIRSAQQGLEIKNTITHLYDVSDEGQVHPLAAFGVDGRGQGAAVAAFPRPAPTATLISSQRLDIGGRVWRLEIWPEAGFFSGERSLIPWIVLKGGLLLLAVFCAFMLTLTGRTIAETRQSKTLADLNQNLAREVREREEAQRELERLATHDPLTGLKNRRVFDQTLDEWIALFQRQKSPFVVCIIDLDHFKQINDVYGHLAGDAVLAEIGRCLSKSVRDTDVIARYGGEEFALLLRDTNAGGSASFLERLRHAVESLSVQVADHSLAVTASFGAAEYSDGATDAVTLMRIADEGLYEAKARGRNQIVLKSGNGTEERT